MAASWRRSSTGSAAGCAVRGWPAPWIATGALPTAPGGILPPGPVLA
ncbi:hypothetical protein [Streptomyces chattanoogensis]